MTFSTIIKTYQGHNRLAMRGVKRPITTVEIRLTLWLSNSCTPLIWRIPFPACSIIQPVRSSTPETKWTLQNILLHHAGKNHIGKTTTIITKNNPHFVLVSYRYESPETSLPVLQWRVYSGICHTHIQLLFKWVQHTTDSVYLTIMETAAQ